MIENVVIDEFAPLFLNIDRVGPFQERMEELDFTDSNDEPCNLYLMLSKNGRGKTTVMELMSLMMGMLGKKQCSSLKFEDFDKGNGRAQWDIKVTISVNGTKETVILSLLAGAMSDEVSLRFWDKNNLSRYGAQSWRRYGFVRNQYGRYSMVGENDQWVMDFSTMIGANKGVRLSDFESNDLSYPTLIYFSAYRNIVSLPDGERAIIAPKDWNYRPLHVFDVEGEVWKDSLDNLLVWLKWLEDGRFEKAVDAVNERVFHNNLSDQAAGGKRLKGVRKEPPEAIVEVDGKEHRLDRLSSGEKSLVQLFLRLGAHMTGNTILLIDEPEVHLHRNWQYEVLNALTGLAKKFYPNVFIMMATHSERIMKAFALNTPEKNLRKGAYLIETIEEEEKASQVQESISSIK